MAAAADPTRITVDELARALHAAGREAVQRHFIREQRIPPSWDEINEQARQAYRVQARWLMGGFRIERRGS
jgi:hypothetical protein